MLTKLNEIFYNCVKDNAASPEDCKDQYKVSCTPKYLQLKSKQPKDKFVCWYTFEKEKDGENLKNIVFFRSINMSHCLSEICCKSLVGEV